MVFIRIENRCTVHTAHRNITGIWGGWEGNEWQWVKRLEKCGDSKCERHGTTKKKLLQIKSKLFTPLLEGGLWGTRALYSRIAVFQVSVCTYWWAGVCVCSPSTDRTTTISKENRKEKTKRKEWRRRVEGKAAEVRIQMRSSLNLRSCKLFDGGFYRANIQSQHCNENDFIKYVIICGAWHVCNYPNCAQFIWYFAFEALRRQSRRWWWRWRRMAVHEAGKYRIETIQHSIHLHTDYCVDG